VRLSAARAARSAFLYHGFMTPEECEHIKNVARPRMERSMVRAAWSQCIAAAADSVLAGC
jgi:hypothetical protein